MHTTSLAGGYDWKKSLSPAIVGALPRGEPLIFTVFFEQPQRARQDQQNAKQPPQQRLRDDVRHSGAEKGAQNAAGEQ